MIFFSLPTGELSSVRAGSFGRVREAGACEYGIVKNVLIVFIYLFLASCVDHEYASVDVLNKTRVDLRYIHTLKCIIWLIYINSQKK